MLRTFVLFCFVFYCQSSTFCQPFFESSDLVEEYRESKKGITLITVIPLHDSAQRKTLDDFLTHLSKKLKRPHQLKIMIIVDIGFRPPWNAIIGYDTLRFDLKFIDRDCIPKKAEEVVLIENGPTDTSYTPPKEVAIDWSGSCDRTNKGMGVKILYKWNESDSGHIYFDRIYSLAKYGFKHFEEIKRNQRRIETKFYIGEWLLSVLTIDTSEIKKIPLESSGFDPNNIKDEKNQRTAWIIPLIVLLALILFFIFKKKQ
jgi:hypothetical protein